MHFNQAVWEAGQAGASVEPEGEPRGLPPSSLGPRLCRLRFALLYSSGVLLYTLKELAFAKLEFQYQEPVGGKTQVYDPEETTKYDSITRRLKPCKVCPENESKPLLHPVRPDSLAPAHGPRL